jgi:hypothetical protein
VGPTTFPRSSMLFLVASTVLAPVCLAGTILYQDDFETDKAMYESYDHSGFDGGDIHLSGYLDYGPGVYGRGLDFLPGFEVDSGDAFISYAVVPTGMIATDGSVSFLLGDAPPPFPPWAPEGI